MQGDVTGLRLSAAQVDKEPAESNSRRTRDVMSLSPEVTDELV